MSETLEKGEENQSPFEVGQAYRFFRGPDRGEIIGIIVADCGVYITVRDAAIQPRRHAAFEMGPADCPVTFFAGTIDYAIPIDNWPPIQSDREIQKMSIEEMLGLSDPAGYGKAPPRTERQL